MGYFPDPKIAPNSLLGNPQDTQQYADSVPLGGTISTAGGVLASPQVAGRTTSGNDTLLLDDDKTSLTSSDSSDVTLTLPAGFPVGFKCKSFQGSTGVVRYIPGAGATIADGLYMSKGQFTLGYFATIENLGNNVWVVTGDIIGA